MVRRVIPALLPTAGKNTSFPSNVLEGFPLMFFSVLQYRPSSLLLDILTLSVTMLLQLMGIS